jgi:hypothetical protein
MFEFSLKKIKSAIGFEINFEVRVKFKIKHEIKVSTKAVSVILAYLVILFT